MLYLISEYMKENPYKKIPALLAFADAEKNLHEMTAEEANLITSNWKPVNFSDALYALRSIAHYFEWLKKQEVEVSIEAKNIKIPTISKDTISIYSTKDIQYYFDMLEKAVETSSVISGESISTNFIKMNRAVGVLSFYGLTEAEILDLNLEDISDGGVKGYNLPLTAQDINVLLAYKNFSKFDNGRALCGSKYIRTSSMVKAADSKYINRYLHEIKISEEYEFLKDVLKTSHLRTLGKFDEAYRQENKRGETISVKVKTPDWFADIFKVGSTWLLKMKREYIAYRERRDRVSPLPTKVEKIKQQTREDIIKDINTINDKILELTQEVQTLTSKLNQLD